MKDKIQKGNLVKLNPKHGGFITMELWPDVQSPLEMPESFEQIDYDTIKSTAFEHGQKYCINDPPLMYVDTIFVEAQKTYHPMIPESDDFRDNIHVFMPHSGFDREAYFIHRFIWGDKLWYFTTPQLSLFSPLEHYFTKCEL